MCWHVSAPRRCRHLRRCRHVPTPLGADTCDISHKNFTWILGCAGKCQHLQRCRHLERCRHVLACVNTSRCRHRCRHIYVPTRADIWMLFGSWDVLTCVSTSKMPTPEKVPTRADTSRCRHVPTPLGADTCDISHMNFTWILGCAGKCQHLQRCRHLERCRHVLACVNTSRCRYRCRHIYVPTRADTCWHMNVIWKLGCADMCQHLEDADTWEGADTCWHL